MTVSWKLGVVEKFNSSAVLRYMAVLLMLTTSLNVMLPVFSPTLLNISEGASNRTGVHRSYHQYMGDDFPRELYVPDARTRVALTVEDSINFKLDAPASAAQWAAILPPGGGYITLGPPTYNAGGRPRRFRIAMFHALSCLDTLRKSVLARHADKTSPAGKDAHYCLNYIRQTVLCRSDIQLEWVRSEYGGKSVQPFMTHENCHDWTAVYNEVERLHDEAMARNYTT